MTTAESKASNGPDVAFSASVLQRIRQHARSSMDAEICGVLLGHAEPDGRVVIDECIRGEGASQGGAHVTFTQDTWQHIYKEKDSLFPNHAIVGWYHSHPGFGIFLSDYDLFIHRNFFSAPHQVAWVFDPHSDEEGCFGWCGEAIQPLLRVAMQSHSRKATVGGRDEPSCTTPRSRKEEPGRWQKYLRWAIPAGFFLGGMLVGAELYARFPTLQYRALKHFQQQPTKKDPRLIDKGKPAGARHDSQSSDAAKPKPLTSGKGTADGGQPLLDTGADDVGATKRDVPKRPDTKPDTPEPSPGRREPLDAKSEEEI